MRRVWRQNLSGIAGSVSSNPSSRWRALLGLLVLLLGTTDREPPDPGLRVGRNLNSKYAFDENV